MQQTNYTFWKSVVKKNSGKLDIVDRINEVIFGLIMVLTFTCAIDVATAHREEVGTVLWAALGCNVAWGIIDAFFYLFGVMMYRGESLQALEQIRNEDDDEKAEQAIKDVMPPLIGDLLKEEHISYLREEIKRLPEPPPKTIFTWNDVVGALKVFLLVFLSTFPVVIPFIFIPNTYTAIRISNGVALILLFIAGFYFGRRTHYGSLTTGLMLMGIGALLVFMTIALGG